MEGAKRKIHRFNSLSRRRNGSQNSNHSRAGSNDDNHNAGYQPETPAFVDKVDDGVDFKTNVFDDSEFKTERGRHPRRVPTVILSPSDPEPEDEEDGEVDGNGKIRRRIPKSFLDKKAKILEALGVEEGEYVDNSPKGSVDEGVKDLIDLINGGGEEEEWETGWVTTSSCAGRVSVFVEGKRGGQEPTAADEEEEENQPNAGDDGMPNGVPINDNDNQQLPRQASIKPNPGGKGGGKWLYVSHSPVPSPSPSPSTNTPDQDISKTHYMHLFGLEPPSSHTSFSTPTRLIHIQFSPLILHVLASTLPHARPLLSAAINAGFRESGVQSLKALEDEDAGVMLAIRTQGLGFESVIGYVLEDEDGRERYISLVGEEFLRICVGVINQRFEFNEVRKGRLVSEVKKVVEQRGTGEEEGKVERRERKREEGLRRQEEVRNGITPNEGEEHEKEVEVEGFGDGLQILEVR